jgi:acetylornithine/N-succinyldiaminopimelate aminotransferase
MSYLFPTYAKWDVAIEKAEGSYAYDANGKKYLDFISGIAVCNLGHCPKQVADAITEQLQKVWHTSNLFHIPLQEEVAKQLVEHSSGDAVFFANSGAEANEAAIKLARKHTGKHKIITFYQSFHGRTFATMTATAQEKVHKGFGPLIPTFEYLPYNDAAAVKNIHDEDIAAFMLEVVQGEGGVIPATKEFLQAVEEKCREIGALFIVDEVQTGIGRTGKAFGYQHYGISPDIITVAKGLGSGFPVGAMIGKQELIESFSPGTHGSTFGGNYLAMAAAKATLETVFQPSFLQSVQEKGQRLFEGLSEHLRDVPTVKKVRGKGLLLGIELDIEVNKVLASLREEGLLALSAGSNVLRLLPPLTVSNEEIDLGLGIIASVLKKEKIFSS